MDLNDVRDIHDSRGPKPEIARFRPISADSHVTEPPDLYARYIDPAFRDRAPKMVSLPGGDIFEIEGVPLKIPVGKIAAAGRDPRDIQEKFNRFEDLHRGGWDPVARLAEQDIDGVVAEMIFPTVGMVVGQIADPALQSAAMQAYNRWLADFCGHAPHRLFGVGQTAVVDVASAIDDVTRIKALGFKGVYMNGQPWGAVDYDDVTFDPLWQACVDLGLPICFHTFGTRRRGTGQGSAFDMRRGAQAVNGWHSIIRDNQDIIGMFIYGGVFERFPGLKLVCVEADAGWAPHFMYRMDHMYLRHRYHQKALPLEKLPSDYFRENVWLTFQDDLIAFQTAHLMNPRRLMWANDYPHADSTWPWSHALLVAQTEGLSDEHKHWMLHQNVKDLFGLEVD